MAAPDKLVKGSRHWIPALGGKAPGFCTGVVPPSRHGLQESIQRSDTPRPAAPGLTRLIPTGTCRRPVPLPSSPGYFEARFPAARTHGNSGVQLADVLNPDRGSAALLSTRRLDSERRENQARPQGSGSRLVGITEQVKKPSATAGFRL